ncbi:MAG TPA: carboxypeptidase-like regulatory domain-containing protein [Methylomirabilota bacterium]|nr:carboxypeptidase-like regulatory domain-containing protein [Methylomirabilota bacterium]
MRSPYSFAYLLATVLVFTSGARAQTTFASITGTVTDAGGAVIPGVAIEATHVRSNYRYTTQSNEAGAYTLSQLREGEYILRASSPGFQEFLVQDIVLISRDVRRIDIQLQVGTVETRIEVVGGATLIETETARIGDAKGTAALNTLPLNTRSLYSFLALTPGVLAAGGGVATRRFAGSRLNQSDQSIDGITVSNGFDGTQISPLVSYIESYEEVRVDMANNTADIGAVGQVTIISKSGSNEFHGSLFTYYTTPWFRARNPFAAQRPGGVVHQPGFAVGGPVKIPGLYNGRNRTFFFGSFETSRGSDILQLLNPTVPIPAWRAGDFSGLGTVVRDPFGSGPLPGNRIPASQINPVSQRYQDRFYPLPNFGDPNVFTAQNYREQVTRPFDPNTYYTLRLDHRFTEKTFVFGRWTWNRSHSREFESNLPTVGRRWQTRDTRALNISFTHMFSPNLVSETRWGFAWNDNPRNGPIMGPELVRELGLTGLVPDLPNINGLLDVSFAGLGIQRVMQTPWRHPGFLNFAQQYQQHLNWFKGKHSLKSGVQLNRVLFQDQQANDALFGRVQFSNRFTGFPYADFLYGIPTNMNRAFPPVLIDRVRWSYEFFVADDWKVTPTLTLNVGFRYELKPGYIERSGRQAVFDIATGRIVVPDGALPVVSPLVPSGYVDIVEASQAGWPSRTLMRTDRNNLAPRFGLAWRPLGPNTVLRAGWGLFYDVVPRAVASGGSPFVLNEPTFTNPANNPVVIFPRVFPDQGGSLSTIGLPAAMRQDLRIPFSMQYNLTIEHQRWNTGFRVSYIGTNTRQGEWGYNINSPVPDENPFISKGRLFPRYPAITYITNGAGHQYHGLQTEVERRFSNGFSYQWSWTWARDIGDLERGQSPENPFDRRRERGVWLDIPTHRVTGNLIYELPFGRRKRFLHSVGPVANHILGGWEVTAIYSYYSGQFVTPAWTGPDPVGIAFTTSATPPNVTLRPDHLRNANLPPGERSAGRWFDVGAFAPPQRGSFGTSARGVIIGPDSRVVNFGLMKSIYFAERARLRAEITATNLWNRANYSLPDANIANVGTVGVISGVGGTATLDGSGPRSFRAGLRFEW